MDDLNKTLVVLLAMAESARRTPVVAHLAPNIEQHFVDMLEVQAHLAHQMVSPRVGNYQGDA